MNHTKSEELYKEAVKYIPGGVNSPVRSFNSVGISPVFAKKLMEVKLQTWMEMNISIIYAHGVH